ncbi:MAG: ABC transporter permease subunit [Thermoflexaceae bacterium]|nr:ABC transporter permease subunit [Thermoflexaceae bacterium]
MTRFGLLRKTLREVRTSVIAVALVMSLMAAFVIVLYPQFEDSLAGFDEMGFYEGFLGEAGTFASPEGFLSAEFFSWIPLLLITVAIIGGTGTLAGEEAAGTLDLLLAQPITRRRLVLEKAAGLSLALLMAALLSLPGFVLGKLLVDFDIGYLRIVEAVLNMMPVTLLYLALAIWGSAALPGRGAAAVVCIGAVVAAYFLNTVGAVVEVLEVPRKLSPFYWADGSHVMLHGFDPLRAGGLLAVAAALLALAVLSFQRRDIASGGRGISLTRLLRRQAPTPAPANPGAH